MIQAFGGRSGAPRRASTTASVTARVVAEIVIQTVVAMDISPDGMRAVLLTYGPAYEYVRWQGETWAEAFARFPRTIVTPPRSQGESICFGPKGLNLYLTSEKLPAPLWEVPATNATKSD